MIQDHEVDQAIDRAARRMMNAEPPGDLRRRVLARLETRRQSFRSIPRYAAAGAFAAACVLAVVLFERGPAPGPAMDMPHNAPTTSAPPSIASARERTQAPPRVPPDRSRGLGVPHTRQRLAVATAAPDPDGQQTLAVAPLQHVAEIALVDVEPRTIAASEIAVAPLPLPDEVTVKPLSPPDARD